MEEGRRKIRACLIFVVAVAVIIGTIYYVHDVKGSRKVNEGTLIENTMEKSGIISERENCYCSYALQTVTKNILLTGTS